MSQDELDLVRKAKRGDHDAMEILFKHHVEAAVRLAYLITKNWATAEDTAQEAFIQAFRSLNTFQEGKPFKPWFTKIVVNKAKRVGPRLNRPQESGEPAELASINNKISSSAEETVLEKVDKKAIFAAINELGDNHRLPLILKYLSGLTEGEISTTLDIPLSTVKSRLYVARQRLKTNLENKERSEHSEE